MNHVLLVEDDVDLREVLAVAFTTINGWDVSSASTSEAALAELASSEPGLVLCDVHLGDDFATEVMMAALRLGVPTLVLTASRATGPVDSPIPTGVAGILEKPIDPHALCELSRDLVAASRAFEMSAPTVLASAEEQLASAEEQLASAEEQTVASFMADRRPRVARDAMTMLGGDGVLTRSELHRLVGRLATYGLHDSAEALRDAEESMAIGRSAGDTTVHDSIVRARERLVEFVAST
jgi:DNA-binding NarL/FixJ family response regulator